MAGANRVEMRIGSHEPEDNCTLLERFGLWLGQLVVEAQWSDLQHHIGLAPSLRYVGGDLGTRVLVLFVGQVGRVSGALLDPDLEPGLDHLLDRLGRCRNAVFAHASLSTNENFRHGEGFRRFTAF
jgi:hypothetical protein